MHTLSACGTSPQLLSLPISCEFRKPGCVTQRTEPFATVFGSVNLAFREAEVVADFVPDGICHDAFEFGGIAGHLFVGTLEDPNAVRAFEHWIGRRPFGNGTAFVEAEQIGGRADRLHDDDEIPHAGAEAAGDIGDGAFHNRVEGFGCEP